MADSTDDLKARLGLKKRRKKAEEEAADAAAKAIADAAAAKAAAKQQAASNIAQAKASAAAADAEAGPAVEDFGFMGQESTPVPERFEGPQYVVVEGSEEMAGQAKQRLLMVVGAAVVSGLVFFFMGNMMGSASRETETVDLYANMAGAKMATIQEAQVKTGDKVLDRIDQLKAAFNEVHTKIGKVVSKKGGPSDADWELLQPQLGKVIEEMGKFKADKVFIDPIKLSAEVFTIGPVANFAMRTQQLYDKVASGFSEAQSIAKVATALPAAEHLTRLVVTEVADREVVQQKWWKTGADGKRVRMTECKDSKDCNGGFTCNDKKKCYSPRVPERKILSVVKAVPDIGRQQVGTQNPADPNSAAIYDWKMMLVLDEKDPDTKKNKIKVASTKDVLQLNLAAAFTEQAKRGSVLVTQRLATIILEAKEVADDIDWAKVEEKLKQCAEQKQCSGGDK